MSIFKNTALFFLLIFFAYSCVNSTADIDKLLGVENKSVSTAKDILMTYSDSAVIRVELRAPVMESRMVKPGLKEDSYPEGIFVAFYDEFGNLSSQLSAKTAVDYQEKNMIIARDSVILISVKGDTFRTEQLHWDRKKARLFNNHPFKYSNPKEQINGYAFESDESFSEFTYKKMSGYMDGDKFKIGETEKK